MKRERIMWVQSRTLHSDDFVLVDGKQTEPGSSLRQKEFSKLNRAATQALHHKEPWAGTLRDVYFMKGLLAENDELGRRKSFLYLMKKEAGDKRQLKKYIQEDLTQIGLSLSAESEEELDRFIRGKQLPFGKNIWAIVIVATILIVFLLLLKD